MLPGGNVWLIISMISPGIRRSRHLFEIWISLVEEPCQQTVALCPLAPSAWTPRPSRVEIRAERWDERRDLTVNMSATNVLVVCYAWLIISPNLCALNEPTLDDVLVALERMVGYYGHNYQVINLDGIFGLRVLEGECWVSNVLAARRLVLELSDLFCGLRKDVSLELTMGWWGIMILGGCLHE